MATPQKAAGAQEGAKVDVLMAIKMLEKALPAFGSGDENGKAILKAITALGKKFGKEEGQTEELMPAEIKAMLQGLAGPVQRQDVQEFDDNPEACGDDPQSPGQLT
jgi:hypothetical protein